MSTRPHLCHYAGCKRCWLSRECNHLSLKDIEKFNRRKIIIGGVPK